MYHGETGAVIALPITIMIMELIMTNSLAKKSVIKNKTITAIAAVAIAVALPQIFHAVGAISGLGSALGSAFLPMHLPVLLAGLLAGPVAGAAAGVLSPAVSFGLSGMPAAIMLPYMMLELAVYGAVAGLMRKTKMPVFHKLFLAQIIGRILRAAAVLVAVYGFGSQAVTIAGTWELILAGLPGILLQWALIPLLMYRMDGLKKHYD